MLIVTNWLPAIAAAAVEFVKPLPPQARAAAVAFVLTPDPRVSPTIVKLAALVVGGRGEMPKLVCPLTSQPANVPVIEAPPAALIVVMSLAVLWAELASPPPETVAMLVTLVGAFEDTLTVSMFAS